MKLLPGPPVMRYACRPRPALMKPGRVGDAAAGVHWTDFETGGHFAALETPDLLVQDIRAFFATMPA